MTTKKTVGGLLCGLLLLSSTGARGVELSSNQIIGIISGSIVCGAAIGTACWNYVVRPHVWPMGPVEQNLPDEKLGEIDQENDSLAVQKRKRAFRDARAACEDRQDTLDLINESALATARMQELIRREQSNPGSLTEAEIQEVDDLGQKLADWRSWEKGEGENAVADLRAAWEAKRELRRTRIAERKRERSEQGA
ncbi:hypothetical protein ACFLX2_00965 [Candidatus Dependentiae bacterium]